MIQINYTKLRTLVTEVTSSVIAGPSDAGGSETTGGTGLLFSSSTVSVFSATLFSTGASTSGMLYN